MKMNKKNKMIIGLLAIAVILFCIIQFGIIPADQEKQVEYAKNQTDALTHDITSIEERALRITKTSISGTQVMSAICFGICH